MGKEADFRREVIKWLRPLGAFPVENANHDGTPDVCCVAGWLELKVVWRPSRLETIVPIDVRKSQRLWHKKWFFHGGRSWLLTQVLHHQYNHILLHTGQWAAEHAGHVDWRTLTTGALYTWIMTPDNPSLVDALLTSRARVDLWKN